MAPLLQYYDIDTSAVQVLGTGLWDDAKVLKEPALVGAWFRRSLLTGLVFVFGWEPLVVVLPGYMKYLSVAYYLQGLAPHAMPQGDALSLIQAMLTSIQTPLATWVSLLALGVIWAAALAASIRAVERREYVLAQ